MRLTGNGKNKCIFCLLILLLWLLPGRLLAQQNLLSQRISVIIENERLVDALNILASKSGIQFSYNSDILNPDQKVSINSNNRRLDRLLYDILGPAFQFKSRGAYVIILRDIKYSSNKKIPKYFTVQGTIRNWHSGLFLDRVSVYDMSGMQSTLSNSAGFFMIRGKLRTTSIALRFARAEYNDTVVFLEPGMDMKLDIRLRPKNLPVGLLNSIAAREISTSDSATPLFTERFIPEILLINSRNVVIQEKRIAQLSLIPTIGTNLKMSGSVVNHLSFNILGGYSNGVSGFEAAGVFNLTRNYVKGFQLAGIANIGADTVNGVQAAGVFNFCRKQLNGLQFSFVANIAKGNCHGVQFAGLMNYAPTPGFQFGIINIADTNNGLPLGVFNIIKGGYYAFSITTDDLLFYSLLIRMGTHSLYSIVGISGRQAGDSLSWGINYGLGSHISYKKRLGMDLELLTSVININKRFDETTVSKVSLSPKISFLLSKKLRITAGPSANMLIAKTHDSIVGSYIDQVTPAGRWHYSSVNTRFETWIGCNASLEFVF